MARDLRSELEQEEDFPPSWKPREDDCLVGELVRYDRATNAYGADTIIAVIDDEERGLVSVWLSGAVLLDKFKRLRPKPGERVGIRCGPKHEKGYRLWRVVVDRPDGEPDWDAVGSSDVVEEGEDEGIPF